jgi:hypothetical protein
VSPSAGMCGTGRPPSESAAWVAPATGVQRGAAITECASREAPDAQRRHFDCRQKKLSPRQKILASRGGCAYLPFAQFRTCLWPRVGWWASGQEAGQPPGANAETR